MLQHFGVVSYAGYLNEQEQRCVLRAFSYFHNEQTPKHKKRISLYWIQQAGQEEDIPEEWLTSCEFPEEALKPYPFEERAIALCAACVAIHPAEKNGRTVIHEVFAQRIPIITLLNDAHKEYVNARCGMLLTEDAGEHLVTKIADTLEILYHDQEVLKLMSKGVEQQYEKQFGWGLKEFRKAAF